MLESNVSVGDTCKEIGVTRHGSENLDKVQRHNAEDLSRNRNFELSPSFFETLGEVEDRVQLLIERLNYQRSENQALRLEIEQLKRTLLVKEEALGISQKKLQEVNRSTSDQGNPLDKTDVENKIDRLVKEIQSCIDTLD
jgi:regulator of replication initiation timing